VVARRVYLHIGASKTGTTYTQDVTWATKAQLADRGVFVPGRRQLDHFRMCADARVVARESRRKRPPRPSLLRQAVKSFDASGAEALLISSEELASWKAPMVQVLFRWFEGFEIHVIYGMRDTAGLLTSSWQERVKNGEARGFTTWLEAMRERRSGDPFWGDRDPEPVLRRWDPGPGGRIHVPILPPRTAAATELWDRFCRILECGEIAVPDLQRPNESLGFTEASVVAMLQDRVSPAVGDEQRRHLVKHQIANQLLAAHPDPVPILIPEEHRDWVTGETERRRGYLEECSHDIVGDLGELTDPPARFGQVRLEDHLPAALGAATEVGAFLVQQLSMERETSDRLVDRLDELEARPGPVRRAALRVEDLVRRAVALVRRRLRRR